LESKQNQYKSILLKYVPVEFINDVFDLLSTYPVIFKVVKPRKTKLGDFRPRFKNNKHQITINGDLNPYAFLITTLHEFAHLVAYEDFGNRINPHGKEWKDSYARLIMPVVSSTLLPKDIEKALLHSLISIKASSCSDMQLQRVLLKYDTVRSDEIPLESLDKNSSFTLNGKIFEKGILKRTRFLCTEKKSSRKYLINALAHVKEIKDEK